MTSNKLILVTGVTGYVGRCLVPRLLEKGVRVRVLVRNLAALAGKAWLPQVEVAHGDVFSPDSLDLAMRGVTSAYYLIHNMAFGRNYYTREIEAAHNFASAAAANGVEHIIYLGGLADPAKEIGLHMRSRIQTGNMLRQGSVPVTEFRASLIIGSGSISFEMIRYLTEQIPLLVGPAWIHNYTQPIAIHNVLDYLLAALDDPLCRGMIYEIGGKDILTYAETMSIYADQRGLRRRMVALPGFPVGLMARAVGKLTPVPASIAGPLLGGMRSDSVVQMDAARQAFPHIQPVDYATSVRLALERLNPTCLETGWENGASSYRINREGFFVEASQIQVEAPPEDVFRILIEMGGRSGWPYLNGLWILRGILDRLVGGPGIRGRRSGGVLGEGDILDFYRVEELETDRLVRLKAELKAPGLGWMEWHIRPRTGGGAVLTQIAYFAPKGVPGFLYWYLLLPFHRLVFAGLIRAVAHRAGKAQEK